MSAVPTFGPLGESDSLTARIDAIWGLSPAVVISVGYHNPNDSEILDWTTLPVTRKQAADMLRDARARHLKVEQSASGWNISGEMHPGWK